MAKCWRLIRVDEIYENDNYNTKNLFLPKKSEKEYVIDIHKLTVLPVTISVNCYFRLKRDEEKTVKEKFDKADFWNVLVACLPAEHPPTKKNLDGH